MSFERLTPEDEAREFNRVLIAQAYGQARREGFSGSENDLRSLVLNAHFNPSELEWRAGLATRGCAAGIGCFLPMIAVSTPFFIEASSHNRLIGGLAALLIGGATAAYLNRRYWNGQQADAHRFSQMGYYSGPQF